MKIAPFAVSLALLPALVACGDSGSSTKNPTTNTPAGLGTNPCGTCPAETYCSYGQCVGDPSLTDASLDKCDIFGFDSTNQAAIARFAGNTTRLRYTASNVAIEPPYDKLVVEMNQTDLFAGGQTSGDFELEGTGERGGALLLRGNSYCNDVDCGFTYVPEGGKLEVTDMGAPGGTLKAIIRDLRLKQVRIDTQSGDLIPFARGKVWCLGDYAVDVPVPEINVADGACVAEGTGNLVGDNIRNFTLQNCNGDYVDLHERCAKSKALWIIASAGWCGACEAFVPEAAERYQDLAGQGLDLMVVVGEDQFSEPPSLEYCMDYALSHGLSPEQTFIDNDGTRSWPNLFTAIDTYSGGSIGLPWNVVLDGRSMEYVWSSNTGNGDLYGAQDELLDAE
ncbi:MAG: redoxin domain-containing protein [Myxococcales bacterium]|nr:redoxin domain-containing protein [Myxococcales bacterium]MCB9731052.1 redoxin domain-containing protein [Deltaproteobacteria bacterium]